ncbi:hypothetical protein OnM2_049028 [Erysiphe neolycopersici]|uniref:Elongin-A n=1 Tax=Erysiphe neolycopersici TaxID=212602 RepID=A0A420HT57_9PEZI|nr:hypothetical protein OnM2_049028 [Erysiphe neolycopersici]
MPVPSLLDICKKACIKNVHSFTDVGDLEYHQISDILFCLKSAEQLHQIEELSPQIKGLDRELWQKFIAKEIPKWETKNYAPKNPLKWYEVYKRYKREQAEEIKRDEERLRESMMGIKKARDSNLSKVVDLGSLPKLPRDPRMTLNNGGVPISRSSVKKERSNYLSFATGSKTKMKDGKSVLIRARREAKEISQMGKLSRPTHKLNIGQVNQAPAAMVKEYRTASKIAPKILSHRASAKPPETEYKVIKEREKRLRALTFNTKSNGCVPNFIDVEDESEGNETNDLHLYSPHDSQSQHTLSSTTTNPNSKRPSDVISAMIAKPKIPNRNTKVKQNNSSLVHEPSKNTVPTSLRPLNNSVSLSKCQTSHDSTSQKFYGSPKSATTIGPKTSIITKKRKDVDIFNHGNSKRPRAP